MSRPGDCPVCTGAGFIHTPFGIDACGRCGRVAEARWTAERVKPRKPLATPPKPSARVVVLMGDKRA